jgi:hypothetical protein
MTKLTKVGVAANGLVANLVSLIETWQPGSLATELKFRDSLLHFIRENVPADCRVEREYRHSGTTTDIFVRWTGLVFLGEVFLEVKRNLNKKATLDRLVGQVESLEPDKRDIVVVLVGDTDKALLGRLKAKYAAFENALPERRMAIVVK